MANAFSVIVKSDYILGFLKKTFHFQVPLKVSQTLETIQCSIIALKAPGCDCTNNNELLHKIGVLQPFATQLFVCTSEL